MLKSYEAILLYIQYIDCAIFAYPHQLFAFLTQPNQKSAVRSMTLIL